MNFAKISATAFLRYIHNYLCTIRKGFGSTEITDDRVIQALAQFEQALISADAPYDRYLRGSYQPTALEQEGITHSLPRV